jgi:hypothetical protein
VVTNFVFFFHGGQGKGGKIIFARIDSYLRAWVGSKRQKKRKRKRKAESGRRKAEGGRRKAEGGRWSGRQKVEFCRERAVLVPMVILLCVQ